MKPAISTCVLISSRLACRIGVVFAINHSTNYGIITGSCVFLLRYEAHASGVASCAICTCNTTAAAHIRTAGSLFRNRRRRKRKIRTRSISSRKNATL